MNLEDLKQNIENKAYPEKFEIMKKYIKGEILNEVGLLGTDKVKKYFLGNESVGRIEYKEDGNKVILKYVWTKNSRLENGDKVKGLGSYMLKDFIENSSYEEYIIDTITMKNRIFFFKIVRYLLKNKIISQVKFIRTPIRANYNKLDDEMKQYIEINHAFKQIIIKK